jgi:hypothetical protein
MLAFSLWEITGGLSIDGGVGRCDMLSLTEETVATGWKGELPGSCAILAGSNSSSIADGYRLGQTAPMVVQTTALRN